MEEESRPKLFGISKLENFKDKFTKNLFVALLDNRVQIGKSPILITYTAINIKNKI